MSTPPVRPGSAPSPIEYTKPAGNPEVRPNAGPPERTPTTSFDVDLYEPRANDTYATISREFYNDTRYETALRAFNKNLPLEKLKQVEVPPIHVLRKRFPQLLGANPNTLGANPNTRPVAAPSTTMTPTPGLETSETAPVFRASGNQTFRVPAGGMTIPEIAKYTLGSEQKWEEIWELNRNITNPGEVLPPGTEVKLPSGAKLPQ